jgi:polysaccharide biosynthesis protein PelA
MKLPWIVYYNDEAPSSAFEIYNPIVFDSDDHPSLAPLLAKKKEILGYIDLAEAEEWRSWFQQAKEAGILIRENVNWPGSWLVDIRTSFWKQLILEEIIPYILNQGFTGLFYDQLDVAIALEHENPQKFAGMIDACISLVQEIRQNFPGKHMMLNRAYEILDRVGNAIDYVLAETLYTYWDFNLEKYRIRSKEEYQWQLAHLNRARAKFPHLVMFSLDYWNPSDKEMYRKIYKKARKQCLRPYVSTLALDAIVPEP